jgi:cysteine desulfurase
VLVCSAIEHHAVLHAVEDVHGRVVAVDGRGVIDLDALDASLDDRVGVVSVMLANNEVGAIQPLQRVVDVVRAKAPHALVHTDAVQAFPWLDVADLAAGADLVTVSAHKFGGPKGVGALVVRDGVTVAARIVGGGQERERRSGTQNVAGIVAMAAAATITVDERKAVVERVGALRDRLADGLLATVTGTWETGVVGGDRSHKVAGSCHVCFDGIESEALLFLLERDGVLAAAGSSCSSGAQEASHVVTAMGVPRELGLGSMRLSLGFASVDADVDRALAVLPGAVERLRRLGS